MTCGVFLHRLASAALPADTADLDVCGQEIPTPSGDRAGVHAQQIGNPLVPAVAELHGLESRIQASLLLVQQGVEQDDRCLQLRRQPAHARAQAQQRWLSLMNLARGELLLARRRALRQVQVALENLLACETLFPHQLQQRNLHGYVQDVVKLARVVPRLGRRHCGLCRGNQRPVLRKPYGSKRPEPLGVETGDLVQRVIAPSVGVARAVGQLLELSEDRRVDLGPQCLLELADRADLVSLEEASEVLCVEVLGPHNRRVALL